MQRYNPRQSPRQSPRSAPSASRGGLPSSPGTRTGLEFNAPVTSRKWRPSPKPAAVDTISVVNCIYRFDGDGTFTGAPGGTWGTAKYIELFMNADTDEYSKDATGICFIGGVQYDFVVTTRAANVSPNAFTFTDVTNANISTVYTSNAITIAGLEATGSFVVSGGTAEKNGSGTWAASGTVVNTDTVKVRGTSSASYETAVDVVLDIGNTSDTYTITTKVDPGPSSGFPFTFPFNLG